MIPPLFGAFLSWKNKLERRYTLTFISLCGKSFENIEFSNYPLSLLSVQCKRNFLSLYKFLNVLSGHCLVLNVQFQKIAILPPWKVLVLQPPRPRSKNLAFKTPPLPPGISSDLPWGGYGFFLEPNNKGYWHGRQHSKLIMITLQG